MALENEQGQDWKHLLLNDLRERIDRSSYWWPRLGDGQLGVDGKDREWGLHLAVFVQPFLNYILEGTKTVEARVSQRRAPAYLRIAPRDVLILKESSGPVIGLAEVSHVWHYELNDSQWSNIERAFGRSLCFDNSAFWLGRRTARFATLMKLDRATRLEPTTCGKKDRRGWVTLAACSGEAG